MPYNLIPEEEYKQRLHKLMPIIIPKGMADHIEAQEMFRLYNDRFDPRETGTFCGACASRVFKRMKEYYETEVK